MLITCIVCDAGMYWAIGNSVGKSLCDNCKTNNFPKKHQNVCQNCNADNENLYCSCGSTAGNMNDGMTLIQTPFEKPTLGFRFQTSVVKDYEGN